MRPGLNTTCALFICQQSARGNVVLMSGLILDAEGPSQVDKQGPELFRGQARSRDLWGHRAAKQAHVPGKPKSLRLARCCCCCTTFRLLGIQNRNHRERVPNCKRQWIIGSQVAITTPFHLPWSRQHSIAPGECSVAQAPYVAVYGPWL